MGALMSLLQILVYCLNLIKNSIVGLFSGGRSQESTPDQSSLQPPSQYQEKYMYVFTNSTCSLSMHHLLFAMRGGGGDLELC